MDEAEFAICYQKLIKHYWLPGEESQRQLSAILGRIRKGEPPGSIEIAPIHIPTGGSVHES